MSVSLITELSGERRTLLMSAVNHDVIGRLFNNEHAEKKNQTAACYWIDSTRTSERLVVSVTESD